MDYQILIVGAGAVGLAIANTLAKKGLSCLVLEENSSFGMETSSRNSEVIHSGIYYPEASLKSRLCIRGNAMLYEYCVRKNIPHKKIGKYIIASDEEELSKLKSIYSYASSIGVPGLSLLDSEAMHQLEPNIICTGAMLSESTGIIDSHALMQSLFDDASSAGVDFAFKHSFLCAEKNADLYTANIKCGEDIFSVTCEYIINCAGLRSDKVAEATGIDIDKYNLRLNYAKGCYFRIRRYKDIAKRLVYPVPPIHKRSLGIHLTIELNGEFKLGPDAEYIDNSSPSYDVPACLNEKFYSAASKYIRGLSIEQLHPDQSGIRPKLQKPGEDFRDFYIEEESSKGLANFINLIGIESPGLTSCLAIAEYVQQYIN